MVSTATISPLLRRPSSWPSAGLISTIREYSGSFTARKSTVRPETECTHRVETAQLRFSFSTLRKIGFGSARIPVQPISFSRNQVLLRPRPSVAPNSTK